MECWHAMRTLRASGAHPGDSPHAVPQQPDLQRLRQSERETEAGTHLELRAMNGPNMTGT